MTTDPIPQQPSEFPAVPAYFDNGVDPDLARNIQFDYERYMAMSDQEKMESAEYASLHIREQFAKDGLTPDRIDEIIEGMRNGTDFSQMDLDIQAGMDPDEAYEKQYEVKGYSLRPSERLTRNFNPGDISGADEFNALAPDVKWMYLLGLRARVMRLHGSGSSYEEVSFYGKLPSDIVEQEAELYTAIVDSQMDDVTKSESFLAARLSPRFTLNTSRLDGPMLPADIRNASSGNASLGESIYDHMPQIALEYLQAAADQLRQAQATA
jgi:hypothetical protein